MSEEGNAANPARSAPEQFRESGYLVSRAALSDDQRRFAFNYILTRYGDMADGDSQVPGTPHSYADFVAEKLLETLQPAVETATGLALYPTYSYLRLYKHGDTLKRHVDRSACEISATLCLGYAPDDPWPIWVGRTGTETSIALMPGDMLIYRGIEVPHWRESYAGERLAQVFLHYVDQNGPHRDWKFDKRPRLGVPRQQENPGNQSYLDQQRSGQ